MRTTEPLRALRTDLAITPRGEDGARTFEVVDRSRPGAAPFWLDDRAHAVAAALDGSRGVADVVRELGRNGLVVDAGQVMAVYRQLVAAGLVVVGGPAGGGRTTVAPGSVPAPSRRPVLESAGAAARPSPPKLPPLTARRAEGSPGPTLQPAALAATLPAGAASLPPARLPPAVARPESLGRPPALDDGDGTTDFDDPSPTLLDPMAGLGFDDAAFAPNVSPPAARPATASPLPRLVDDAASARTQMEVAPYVSPAARSAAVEAMRPQGARHPSPAPAPRRSTGPLIAEPNPAEAEPPTQVARPSAHEPASAPVYPPATSGAGLAYPRVGAAPAVPDVLAAHESIAYPQQYPQAAVSTATATARRRPFSARTLRIALVAALLPLFGLGLGYLVFGRRSAPPLPASAGPVAERPPLPRESDPTTHPATPSVAPPASPTAPPASPTPAPRPPQPPAVVPPASPVAAVAPTAGATGAMPDPPDRERVEPPAGSTGTPGAVRATIQRVDHASVEIAAPGAGQLIALADDGEVVAGAAVATIRQGSGADRSSGAYRRAAARVAELEELAKEDRATYRAFLDEARADLAAAARSRVTVRKVQAPRAGRFEARAERGADVRSGDVLAVIVDRRIARATLAAAPALAPVTTAWRCKPAVGEGGCRVTRGGADGGVALELDGVAAAVGDEIDLTPPP